MGEVYPLERRRFVTPKPFMSGSMTSRMMRSGSSSSTAEMACAPLPTARTAKPAKRRLVVRRSRMFGSSSTMRILGPSLMRPVSASFLSAGWMHAEPALECEHGGMLSLPPLATPVRRIGARSFDFSREVAVMGIVNRTPDSFYDQGRTFGLEAAVSAALEAVAAGADIIDIGGVPFAPGDPLPPREEAERVVPVIEAVRAASDVVISVDTFHAEVARRSIAAGADIINDTTGLSDPDMVGVVGDSEASLVITHSLATPRTQYPRPHYDDVVVEVVEFLRDRVERAVAGGLTAERIIIDPGPDLNKNTLHMFEIVRRFDEIAALGLPVLAALSNKDFIGETLDAPKPERLEGSLAAAVASVLQGARIVRVHEVAPTVATVRMVEAILGIREPAYLKHNTMEFNVREADAG